MAVEQLSSARLPNVPRIITLLRLSFQPMITSARRSALLPVLIFCLLGVLSVSSTPVEFSFQVEHDPDENPFSRDIWAELQAPSGRSLRLPAFYDGDEI